MLNRTDTIKLVKSYAERLVFEGIPLENVFLYGSYSKNTFNENSDIDVALVSKVFTGFGFEDRRLLSKVNILKEFINIEPKTFNTNSFEKGNPFVDEIKKSGILIYTKPSEMQTS